MNSLKFNPTAVLAAIVAVIIAGMIVFAVLVVTDHSDSVVAFVAFVTPTVVALLALTRTEGVSQTINGTKEKVTSLDTRVNSLERKSNSRKS